MSNNSLKINYIELPAEDFDAIEAFYSKAFGWHFTDYGPEYRAFSDGRTEGGFTRSDKVSSSLNGAALVILYSADIESTRERVLESGGQLVVDIFKFPGGRRFQFSDPHGNELAVWSDKQFP